MEGYDYEVFLSFRGPDTRADFTDHLYTRLKDVGVRTYKDDEDLRAGEEIGPNLLRAMEQSKIFIPIFSISYASSRWCLKELAQMVDCWKRKEQVIMPIFYDVEPSEVQNQTGRYGEALLVHENKKRVDDETIRKWRAALKEVGGLKGWNRQDVANRSGGELVKGVVTMVLSKLKKAYLVVSDFLLGVNDSVKEVLGMIGTDTDDTKIVGIHGMGGIGKTTLAKIVYNKLSGDFANYCFLADVRESSHQNGILWLQSLLISDLSKQAHPWIHCTEEGIKTIEERFSHKKVLILLDDVDEKSQLTALLGRQGCFGPGSRILITTRNAIVLHEFGVKMTYEVGGLDFQMSLQLFSKHAFKRDCPPIKKMEKSREFVMIAEGLPLALEVMGSTLSIHGQKEEMWDDWLLVWKKGHIKSIGSKLKTSYDALDFDQKQIFLDIACLFDGYDKSTTTYMWRDRGLYPTKDLEVLQLMSLIKIGEDNILWMHNQLKYLGREIVSQESGGKLYEQSRLWNHRDALEVLQRKEGTKRVEGVLLKFDSGSEWSFGPTHFENMSNIRFLRLDQANLEGNFKGLLSSLRWLHWQGCPRNLGAQNLDLEKLVILDLSWSKVHEKWNGWSEIEKAGNLKVLNLTGCVDLIRTPDLSHYKCLERLILEKCDQLVEIGSSVKSLRRLVSLNLRCCTKLSKLPEELGFLMSLEEILIDGTAVQEIPASVGHLKNLRISARNCLSSIQLPESISCLIEAESSSEVEVSKPDNTEHSSSKGVDRKYEGNDGGIDYIRSNDGELMKLNSFPDGGTGWRKIGKISVSRIEIAKGSNGTIVYEGKYEDRHVAVKQLVGAHHAVAINEIQKLKASDKHENIVRYFGEQCDEDFVYLALERCDCSLDDLIQVHSNSSNNSVSDDSASMDDYKIKCVRNMMEGDDLWREDGYPSSCLLKLMRDVVSGLEHLHYLKIIHQDLKPQNVLITNSRSLGAKLSDMGISTCLPKDRSSMGYRAIGCGSSGWRAPEQLKGGRQTSAMDLFSLGCVLFFCITCGGHPFGEILFRDSNIAKNQMDLSSVKFIPEAHDLLSRLLNEDPNLRPKASEVLHHPFFWSSEVRLSFFREVSDKVELEARAPNSDLLKALENTAQLVFDGNWGDKIEPEVMADLRKHRKYDCSRVRDLLRAVRNKFSHTEASDEVEEILGSDADGLDIYFTGRFPRLLMEVYRVVSRICKEQKRLQKYLLFPLWPLPTEIPSSSQQGLGHEAEIH
ncbi:disease resistance protein L6-like [Syzygium oleosum]|uniref:disease resistance protein L6-like n=1 Tax=Syzygium oleosum TaxID=219896 RepID=UPI0024BAD95A|nr:disease resistance protein L6-like [Syzygium oleosum]